MEIERRFLVKDKEKVEELIEKYKTSKKTITQDYIYSDTITAIRKRKIEENDNVKYIYTIKTGRKGISVNEIESEITKEKYDFLRADPNRITIVKERYIIPYINDLKIELDIFHGIYEGVVFAEIEFKSEEQANNIKLPEWFGLELTEIITNNTMSKKFIDFNNLK